VSGNEPRPDDDARGLRVRIVAARWNERFVERLLAGALETLRARGAADADVEVWWVPGSFELPLAARWAADAPLPSGPVDAVIALGCVIRGETEHFRLVAEGAAQGLQRVALDTGVPVLNGVLAVHDPAQAEARSGGTRGNTGAQVALAAVSMAALHAASRETPRTGPR
jgi:6,7-dimethyl-8-ribityllumazine synthase